MKALNEGTYLMIDSRLSQEQVAFCYDELARSGIFPDNTDLHSAFLDIINSDLESAPLHILDAGGGTGFFAIHLAIIGHQVTLLDLSSEALNIAQKRGQERKCNNRIIAIKGDVENLPFPDESFDVIICTFVLAHLNNPAKAFEEFRRVLRKGGRLFVSFENKLWHVIAAGLCERYEEAIALISSKSPIVRPYDSLPPIRVYSTTEILELCRVHGFRVRTLTGMRHLTSYQEPLKGIRTTEAEELLHNNPKAQELEKLVMESGELLCLARHIFVCCKIELTLGS